MARKKNQPRSEGIKNLGGIGKRGHARAKFRHDSRYAVWRFRASTGAFRARSIRLGDRFFRYFTLFLVCLVLFAVVTDAGYSTYQMAVDGLYTLTETVSDLVNVTLSFAMDTVGFVSDLKDNITQDGDLDFDIDGDNKKYYQADVKIGNTKTDFIVYEVRKVEISGGATLAYKIVEAPPEYSDWIGKNIVNFALWYMLPSGRIIFLTSFDLSGINYTPKEVE